MIYKRVRRQEGDLFPRCLLHATFMLECAKYVAHVDDDDSILLMEDLVTMQIGSVQLDLKR